MGPKTVRPSKKALAKAGLSVDGKKGSVTDELSTTMSTMSLDTLAKESDDDGRTATGILVSEERARDIKINAFSLSLFGHVLVEDTTIELNQGGRYGLLGRNGSGKSTFLKCLANREVPIPPHFNIYLLAHVCS